MKQGIGFFLISGFCIFIFVSSIQKIMIGMSKLKHPMYDNDSKKKMLLKKGIIGVIIGTICGVPFCYWSIMIILIEINK